MNIQFMGQAACRAAGFLRLPGRSFSFAWTLSAPRMNPACLVPEEVWPAVHIFHGIDEIHRVEDVEGLAEQKVARKLQYFAHDVWTWVCASE